MASNEPPPPYYEGMKVHPPPYAPEENLGGPQQQPPPPGWGAMPPPPPPYQYGATSTTTVTIQPGLHGQVITSQQTPIGTQTRVIIVPNGCPNCRAGVLTDSYGFCAIFMALFFFPIGILCCLAMRERRCTNCGASF